MGLTDSLVRLSCGIEDAADLIADHLEPGLGSVGMTAKWRNSLKASNQKLRAASPTPTTR